MKSHRSKMNVFARQYLLAVVFIVLMSFVVTQKNQITVYLIGDSTVANKDKRNYPETGWGMPFGIFFDSTVRVDNRAKNGRSTKSFREEGLWAEVYQKLKSGDYVLIQFGHNDESPEKVGRYTTPEQFKQNLKQYVTEVRSKNAIPILMTPVARRSFDSAGRIVNTHGIYGDLVKEVAASNNVSLIDLQSSSMQTLQEYGVEHSKVLFNWLKAGQHPNYPDGREDNTHFSEYGARIMAELVLSDIRKLNTGLERRIIKKKA